MFPELSWGHVSLKAASSISLSVYTDFVLKLKNHNGSSVPSPEIFLILSSFTHPLVIPNLYDFLSSTEQKKKD